LEALVDDATAFLDGVLFRSVACYRDRATEVVATAERLWDDALSRGTRTPELRVVRGGATVTPSAYCRTAGVGHRTIDDLIQPNRVLELYDDGATVVLQGLQLTDPHLARLVNNLALALDLPVQVNAYLSPPSARGLELHIDLHDVFVVQLEGTKRWRVWEALARTRDPVKSGPAVPPPTLDELGTPIVDAKLQRDDVLYLPRGHPHCAETVEDASVHLTIGILALTWHRALRAALDAAVADGHWRSTVRRGPADLSLPARVATSLAPHLDQAAVRRWVVREVWRRQPATRLRRRRPPTLEPSTPLAITPGPLVWLERGDERCVLGLGDRQLLLPVEAHRFVAELVTTPVPVPMSELAGLDDESKRVVIERLSVEGVVAPG
jgi:bifunctional lysine-specific demethylase and histidyl-hydroxylase NO66